MARTPTPWFWEERAEWCVNYQGQRHKLGSHPSGFPAPKKFHGKWNVPKPIEQKFHELLGRPEPAPAPPVPEEPTVAEVFERFLDWCAKHRSEGTYQWFQSRIQRFIDYLRKAAAMPVSALKPYHVVEWVDKHPSWGAAFRRGVIVALQRPFNWAVKLGYIPANPIRYIEKPQVNRREQSVTPTEWAKIRDHYEDGNPFRDLLEFAWETGCRPQEVKNIEPRHVQLAFHRVVFPKQEAKGKRQTRIIYMTPRAEEIIGRLLAMHPSGLLFLNNQGRPWTNYAMSCRFVRLKAHLGVKYACYSLRHGFATRKLEDGLDHLTVAALMGHSDGTMLARFYSHIGDRGDHLRQQLLKGPVSSPANA
jgi:integrase